MISAMNEFLVSAIEQSGLTKADTARKLGVTAQAVNSVIKTRTPKPPTLAAVLFACGWNIEEIGDLTLLEVYGNDLYSKIPAPPHTTG